MSLETILLITMSIAWTVGGVGAIFFRQRSSILNSIHYGLAFLGSLSGLLLSILIFKNNHSLAFNLWSASKHFLFSFSLDLLSAFFLFIITSVALIVTIYTPKYLEKYKNNINFIGSLFNLFLLSLVGVVMASNAFSFIVMWEVMSILSFFLVIVKHKDRNVLSSGRLYLIMTHLGTGFIFLAFLLLYFYTGSINFDKIQLLSNLIPAQIKSIVFVFSLIGFGMKAGLVPLHIWLPRAHPVAPSHISTLMSAVMIKTAIYGILRVVYDLLGVTSIWWGVSILIIGMITAAYGILFGVIQDDIKRFLAYSSIENMGLIFMGIGVSIIFAYLELPVLAALALIAALYHTLNHAFFKSILFMGAGAIDWATGTKKIDELGGLIRWMPQTASLFLLGSLAIASFPPFNGFISKWLTFQSMIQLSMVSGERISMTFLGVLAAVTLVFIGGLVALGFVKLYGVTFLAQPRTDKVKQATEVPLSMRLAMGLSGLAIVVLGIIPSFVAKQITQVTYNYFPEYSYTGSSLFSFKTIADTEMTLSPILLVVLLIVVGIFLIFGLWRWLGKSVYVKEEPWACGVRLEPNMSYSGMSFSHPVLLIFRKIFGDATQIFYRGDKVKLIIMMHHLFDRFLYQPLIEAVIYISKKIRRMQDGSIHTYLAYVFVSLIILLLIATI